MIKIIHGGVTAPSGFRANGVVCGIKKSKKKDLALIVSDRLCIATGTFTQNQLVASCVTYDRDRLKGGRAQAIIANSGNANCLNGTSGMANTVKMAKAAAEALGIRADHVLTGSTGVIGVPLPIKKILAAVPTLAAGLSRRGSGEAAQAILTTDRLNKEIAVEIKIGRRAVRIGAIAKGAGMIHPNMILTDQKHATMLCYITTDAAITLGALRAALGRAAMRTFNAISIDADQSTNDMAVILANGAAQNAVIREGTPEFKLFAKALEMISLSLAKLMVQDAEGATKFVEISVRNARTQEEAREAARSVASSKLVKCALFGSDPNWGRIAAAVGYSRAHVDPKKIMVKLGSEVVLRNGGRAAQSPAALHKVFRKKNIKITVDLGVGKSQATAWTCDLSTGYVRINSAYRT